MKSVIYFFSSLLVLALSAGFCSCNNTLEPGSNDNSGIFEGDPTFVCNEAWSVSNEKFLQMSRLLSDDLSVLSDYALPDDKVQMLEEAIHLYDVQGIDYVLNLYGISEDIFLAASYYSDNVLEANVLENLVKYFPDLSQSDFELVFDIYNCSIILSDYLPQSRAMKRGCAIAIAGTVVSCFSACAIGNVAGLCWWIASYSITLVGLVDACA